MTRYVKCVNFILEIAVGVGLILLSILAALCGWGNTSTKSWGISRSAFICSILVILAVIGGVCYVFYPSIIYSINSHQESTPTTTTESIYSLKSADEIHGSFFLGCGDINSVTYYEFYYKSGGAYYLGKVPADGTAIYTDENQFPYLQTITWREIDYHPDGTQTDYGRDYSHDTQYILHVPSNTIKGVFALGGSE